MCKAHRQSQENLFEKLSKIVFTALFLAGKGKTRADHGHAVGVLRRERRI